MIPLQVEEIEALSLGRLERGERAVSITGIKADSRLVAPGDLFAALNTGVRYLGDARARGAAIGSVARELDIEVIGVGEPAVAYRPAVHVAEAADAVAAARSFIGPGDAMLVKASRAVGLEGIADEITNIAATWSLS